MAEKCYKVQRRKIGGKRWLNAGSGQSIRNKSLAERIKKRLPKSRKFELRVHKTKC